MLRNWRKTKWEQFFNTPCKKGNIHHKHELGLKWSSCTLILCTYFLFWKFNSGSSDCVIPVKFFLISHSSIMSCAQNMLGIRMSCVWDLWPDKRVRAWGGLAGHFLIWFSTKRNMYNKSNFRKIILSLNHVSAGYCLLVFKSQWILQISNYQFIAIIMRIIVTHIWYLQKLRLRLWLWLDIISPVSLVLSVMISSKVKVRVVVSVQVGVEQPEHAGVVGGEGGGGAHHDWHVRFNIFFLLSIIITVL